MEDNGRQLKSMEYAAFDPGSGYESLKVEGIFGFPFLFVYRKTVCSLFAVL